MCHVLAAITQIVAWLLVFNPEVTGLNWTEVVRMDCVDPGRRPVRIACTLMASEFTTKSKRFSITYLVDPNAEFFPHDTLFRVALHQRNFKHHAIRIQQPCLHTTKTTQRLLLRCRRLVHSIFLQFVIPVRVATFYRA